MIYPKMINNFSYILNKRTTKAIKYFILFLVLCMLSFILIGYKYEYNLQLKYFGYVKKEDKFYVYVYALENDVNNIKNSLLCNNMNYKILNISETLISDNKKVREIKIDINLEDKELIENNIVELNFMLNKTTLFNEIRKEINEKFKQK